MKVDRTILVFAAGLLLARAGSALAAVRYVDVNSPNSMSPYTSWATAAPGIQEVIEVAVAGDEIVVTNGTYSVGGRSTIDQSTTTNRVVVDKPLALRSVNGPQSTIIDGGGVFRCVYLTNGASLSGLTLTNGAAYQGAGLWCESTNAVVSNCVMAGNSAYYAGGGVYGGTLNNCVISGNSATAYGGGAYGGTLNDCALSGNSTAESSIGRTGGGGAALGTLNNCVLTDNFAFSLVVGANNSYLLFGGRGGGAFACQLNNCALRGNSAYYGGGAFAANLNNCTLTGNSASGAYVRWVDREFGSVHELYAVGGGSYFSTGHNCIQFNNVILTECEDCATRQLDGNNNWSGDPLFTDQAAGNLRLQSNSPCISAGLNAFGPAGPDLDGRPRIKGGTVDIGAYEFQAPTSIISYAWLQQYGLSIDGSADSADADSDGMSNWQEWRCATDPTNALSVLRLLAPVTEGTNLVVPWQSVTGVNYFLERSTAVSSAFMPLATDIPGQPGTTIYIDTNAIGTGPRFYRVGSTR